MNIEGADEVWRRIQAFVPDEAADAEYRENPTHPTHAMRFAAFREWIPEIKAKQAQGLPLVPEKQDWRRWIAEHGGLGAIPAVADDSAAPAATAAP